jgi:hypothetical protein
VPEHRVAPPQVGIERIGRVGVEVVGAGVAAFILCEPRTWVRFTEMLCASFVASQGKDCPWPMVMNLVFGSALAPANDMFGRMWFGLFSEKYCWWPGR